MVALIVAAPKYGETNCGEIFSKPPNKANFSRLLTIVCNAAAPKYAEPKYGENFSKPPN